MSHYADLSFSDEEVITLFLFGVMDKHREIKGIYEYADRHLRDGFPRLPSYVYLTRSHLRILETVENLGLGAFLPAR